MRDSERKILEVLCDSGEDELRAEKGQKLGDVLNAAASALDGACLTNVVVVRTYGRRFFVGEFSFDFCEVDEAEAKRIARDFSPPDYSDEED